MYEEENENIPFINNDIDTDADSEESKDFTQDINKDEFNIKNIDFKDLREKLNDVYNDEKLTANAINHIRKNLNSSTEVQCETKGMKNKISITTKGDANGVNLSKSLILRSKNNEQTLQILHNHTSGKPLPHLEDMSNMIKYKLVNSGIVGNYGYLNMKNSFKELNEVDMANIKTKAEDKFKKLERNAFKDNPYIKYESDKIRKVAKYKYYKENINTIIKEYNNEFKKYGIEFKYTPYKLKKR